MPLKFRVKTREEVPTEHQSLYVERDGAFVLDVEGAVEKTRLDEFRSTNVALRREVESLNTRLADNSVESMVLQVASKFGPTWPGWIDRRKSSKRAGRGLGLHRGC
jgi:hypothetical protein